MRYTVVPRESILVESICAQVHVMYLSPRQDSDTVDSNNITHNPRSVVLNIRRLHSRRLMLKLSQNLYAYAVEMFTTINL